MFCRLWIASILIALCCVVACGKKNLEDAATAQAAEFIDLLVKRDFVRAASDFDSTMMAELPPERLQEIWATVMNQYGPFKQRLDSRVEANPRYSRVTMTCEFEISKLDIRVVLDRNDQIAGLFFIPVTTDVETEQQQPPYARLDSFTEKEVIIGRGEWTLPATLSLPGQGENFPALVLVHGSGPQDRDETIGPNKPFRDLAWGLASQGVAVLRYDKRTKHYNEKIVELRSNITVNEETVADALEAVAFLRRQPAIDGDRIFVLGHSLGGSMLPRIGKQDPRLAGLVVMAGGARPLEDVIYDQYTYLFSLDGEVSESEQAELDKLEEQIEKVKDPQLSEDTPREDLPFQVPARYWLDLRDYDPAEAAKSLPQPLLILRGGRDYQVTAADYEQWRQALSDRDDVEFKLYPSLNHLFIAGEGQSSPQEYEEPGHVAKVVVDDISAWLARH